MLKIENDPLIKNLVDEVQSVKEALPGSRAECRSLSDQEILNVAAYLTYQEASGDNPVQRTQAAYEEPKPDVRGHKDYVEGILLSNDDNPEAMTIFSAKIKQSLIKPTDHAPTERSVLVWLNARGLNRIGSTQFQYVGRVVFDESQPDPPSQSLAPIWTGEPRVIIGKGTQTETVPPDDVRAQNMVEIIRELIAQRLDQTTPEISDNYRTAEYYRTIGRPALRVLPALSDFELPSVGKSN